MGKDQVSKWANNFSESVRGMISKIAEDNWICPHCLSTNVGLWKPASLLYLRGETEVKEERMILDNLYRYCLDCEKEIYDHHYDSFEKWDEYSDFYINFAIFSHVRLQSKNINPNLTSFVVETVNTALGPACSTKRYPSLPLT